MNEHPFWHGLASWESWWMTAQMPEPIRPNKFRVAQVMADTRETANIHALQGAT